jgi:hypothetical protein
MFEVDLEKYYPETRPNNTVLCNVRKRLVHKTPEEVVRQSVIKYLTTEKGYPINNFDVEVPLSRIKKKITGRADIVIYDDDENVLCLIECKALSETLTDSTIDQLFRYDDIFNAEILCFVIGNSFYVIDKYKHEKLENPVIFAEFPKFNYFFEDIEIEYFLPETVPFEKHAVTNATINLFIEAAIFGESTDEIYFPFLINLYNFFVDESDTLNLEGYEDLGLKYNKYGNAGGGSFHGEYRGILEKKSQAIVSFSISSMTSGVDKPVFTSLLFAVDVKGHFHLSLELRVDKHIKLEDGKALITHDGTITIGKLGSAKRAELIAFIAERKPDLIRDQKVFLGEFDTKTEIKSNQKATQEFIQNSISYALIRDEFRAMKKS